MFHTQCWGSGDITVEKTQIMNLLEAYGTVAMVQPPPRGEVCLTRHLDSQDNLSQSGIGLT